MPGRDRFGEVVRAMARLVAAGLEGTRPQAAAAPLLAEPLLAAPLLAAPLLAGLVAVDDWLPADCTEPGATYRQCALHADPGRQFSLVTLD